MPLVPHQLTGMNYRKTTEYVAKLDDGSKVTLRREADNKFDPRAVQVHAAGTFVGYIAKHHNKKLAAHMDRTNVTEIDGVIRNPAAKYPMIEIDLPAAAQETI